MIKLPSVSIRRPEKVASLIKLRWREGEAPDAVEALRRHPEIACRHSLALEIALEDYCLRKEAGESIESTEFCQQFADIRHSLARQIEVYDWVIEHADDASPASWPEPGDLLFDKYRVQEELGRGSLARAYLCRHVGLHRQVVVKVASRGEYEARTLARFDNDTIMPVLDVTTDAATGTSGLCMPFLGRSTLHCLLDEAWKGDQPPESPAVLLAAATRNQKSSDAVTVRKGWPQNVRTYVDGIRILAQDITDALLHAHQARVTHGDLKPSNVLLTPAGRAVLMDFNLSNDATVSGVLTGGTIPYMSPEQIRSLLLRQGSFDDIGPSSDIYSLGVILFELLSGKLPFEVPLDSGCQPVQIAEAMLAAQADGPPDLRELNPHVDVELANAISHCLQFDPSERPAELPVWFDRQPVWTHAAPESRVSHWRGRMGRWTLIGLVLVSLAAASVPWIGRMQRLSAPEAGLSAAILQLVDEEQWYRAIDAMKALPPQEQTSKMSAMLGYCYQQASLSDRRFQSSAEYHYRRALEHGFRTPGLLNNMGVARSVAGVQQEALAWFELALRQSPSPEITKSNKLFAVLNDAVNCADFYPEPYRQVAEQLLQEYPGFRSLEESAAVLTTRCAHFDSTLIDRAVELWLLSGRPRGSRIGPCLLEAFVVRPHSG